MFQLVDGLEWKVLTGISDSEYQGEKCLEKMGLMCVLAVG